MVHSELLGPYTYTAPPGVFPLGQDTLLLGNFATVRRAAQVCDLGCGGGALLLLLLAREPTLRVTGVERSPDAAQAAGENLSRNGLEGTVLKGDLRGLRGLLPAGGFDLAVSNPPWFAAGSGRPGGPCRCEEACTLEEVCRAAGYLLRSGGRFALVHRPERLADVMAALRRAGLEPKRLRLVQHSASHPPSAVLLEAVRQGRPGLELAPTLILNTPEVN